jgi:glycosyltransferase involved in cell wall biosynthesis
LEFRILIRRILSIRPKISKTLTASETDSKGMPTSTPFFSIGVTTYNRPELLKQTLASITMQTFANFEVIVGNDYVQEPLSANLLDLRDPRIRFVNHPRNLGEARNMNTLLDLSRGLYFTWQCDDDLYAPNFLEEVHSALVKFNLPPCVFTSYEFIYGISSPHLTKTLSRKGQLFSGRQFLRMYWSGKLKAMGCTGVYDKEYLKRIGGVECLTDTSTPLYSEHLLLVLAGLLQHVAHIDEPLVKYRIHEGAWGCSATDLWLYGQASQNLVRESITVFSDPTLRDDFRSNITSLLKFVVFEYFNKTRARDGCLSRHESVPFFFSLKMQFKSLQGLALYRIALVSWGWTGLKLAWWLVTKFNLKAAISSIRIRFACRFHSILQRHRQDHGP